MNPSVFSDQSPRCGANEVGSPSFEMHASLPLEADLPMLVQELAKFFASLLCPAVARYSIEGQGRRTSITYAHNRLLELTTVA